MSFRTILLFPILMPLLISLVGCSKSNLSHSQLESSDTRLYHASLCSDTSNKPQEYIASTQRLRYFLDGYSLPRGQHRIEDIDLYQNGKVYKFTQLPDSRSNKNDKTDWTGCYYEPATQESNAEVWSLTLNGIFKDYRQFHYNISSAVVIYPGTEHTQTTDSSTRTKSMKYCGDFFPKDAVFSYSDPEAGDGTAKGTTGQEPWPSC